MKFKPVAVVYLGLMMAMSVVLTRFFSVYVPVAGIAGIRLSFGEIPLILSGILFGPVAGGITGGLADLVGVALFPPPGGAFFPGFTVSSALMGMLPGIFLHHRVRAGKPITPGALFGAILATDVVVSMILNTLWVSMLYHKAIAVILPARLVARAILIPAYTGILYVIVARYHVLLANSPALGREAKAAVSRHSTR